MNEERANELLDRFPELISLLEKISELDSIGKRRYGDQIILAILQVMSKTDGNLIAALDRMEHQINLKEPNILVLGQLSRARYKVNQWMDFNK